MSIAFDSNCDAAAAAHAEEEEEATVMATGGRKVINLWKFLRAAIDIFSAKIDSTEAQHNSIMLLPQLAGKVQKRTQYHHRVVVVKTANGGHKFSPLPLSPPRMIRLIFHLTW